MKFITLLRVLLSVLFSLLYLKGIGYALYAMNMKSDIFPALGVSGAIVATFALYKILKNVWRKNEA